MLTLDTTLRHPRSLLALAVALFATLALAVAALAPIGALAQSAGDEPLTEGEAGTDDADEEEEQEEDVTEDEGEDTEEGTDGDAGDDRGDSEVGRGLTNLTRDLDLQGARIHHVNLDDTEEEFAVFAFGSFVRSVENEDGFALGGYAAESSATSTSARIVSGSPNEVLVAFPAGTDLRAFTIATVDSGTVADENDERNVAATAVLDGSAVEVAEGSTAGPDLVATAIDDTLDRVAYHFDKALDEDQSADASGFGYYTASGQQVTGSSIVTIKDGMISVEFDDRVDDGVLFYAEPGALQDRQGLSNTTAAAGGPTTAPGLIEATTTESRTQIDFSFSEPMTDIDASGFHVYDEAGSSYEGSDYVRLSSETVRVVFIDIRDFSDTILRAGVDHGAVQADDGSDVEGTIGSALLRQSNGGPGFTSGPDLTDAQVDVAAGQVRFHFDELLDDQIDVDANRFHVLTESGTLLQGRSVVEVTDNSVLVIFDRSAVRAAEGFVIQGGAVQDFSGEENVTSAR